MAEREEPMSYQCDSCIRGYHIYRAIWNPTVEETLDCMQESSNPRDRYAVSVLKDGQIVGHLPRKISRLCSLFIGRDGTITATVTGEKRRSTDLPQGGIEIPCRLNFSGPGDVLLKAKHIIELLKLDKLKAVKEEGKDKKISEGEGSSKGEEEKAKEEGIAKGEKQEEKEGEGSAKKEEKEEKKEIGSLKGKCKRKGERKAPSEETTWVQFGRHTLSLADKNSLSTGQWLSDQHMNFVQALLKEQFPHIAGLRNTLSLNSTHSKSSLKGDSLQIIFCRGNHWLVACTVNSVPNVVTIYDSLHRDAAIDHATKCTLAHLTGIREEDLQVDMEKMVQQVGGADCGVFAAAAITSLAYGDHGPYHFNQMEMREHLLECIENCKLTPFPTTNN